MDEVSCAAWEHPSSDLHDSARLDFGLSTKTGGKIAARFRRER